MADSQSSSESRNAGAPSPKNSPFGALLWIPIVALGAWVFVTLFLKPPRPSAPTRDQSLPALAVEGWLNGAPPDDLAGKVVVLEAWASWCGPCAQLAPELVELHEKYSDQGVVFIGMSSENQSAVKPMQKFLDRFGITWPNAYGADQVFDELEIFYIPATFVFGRDGKLAWSADSGGRLEDGIDEALSKTAELVAASN